MSPQPHSLAALGSLSRSLNLLKYSKASGFCTVALALTSFPLINCFTGVSTFFPLIVVGISGTSRMNFGTCLVLNPSLIAFFNRSRSSGVREYPWFIITNRNTCSSVSLARRRPTQRLLEISLLNGAASTIE